jgi:hypothetical protein
VGAGLVVIGIVLMGWSLYRIWRVSQDIERARTCHAIAPC